MLLTILILTDTTPTTNGLLTLTTSTIHEESFKAVYLSRSDDILRTRSSLHRTYSKDKNKLSVSISNHENNRYCIPPTISEMHLCFVATLKFNKIH